jgi:hypothetical protein
MYTEVLGLLANKNQCLKQFLRISREFFEMAETGDFSGLPAFESRREANLKTISIYDEKIQRHIEAIQNEPEGSSFSAKTQALVRQLLDEKNRLVGDILDLDLRIIRLIESEKSRLFQTILSDSKTKKTLST